MYICSLLSSDISSDIHLFIVWQLFSHLDMSDVADFFQKHLIVLNNVEITLLKKCSFLFHRSLGYDSGVKTKTVSLKSVSKIFLNVGCGGNEHNISECQVFAIDETETGCYYVTSVHCYSTGNIAGKWHETILYWENDLQNWNDIITKCYPRQHTCSDQTHCTVTILSCARFGPLSLTSFLNVTITVTVGLPTFMLQKLVSLIIICVLTKMNITKHSHCCNKAWQVCT